MIITGGADWKEVLDVVRPAGPIPCAFLLLYILLFSIAVWNVVTSIFLDKALKLAQPDVDELMLEARRKDVEDTHELQGLFAEMVMSDSNVISLSAFEDIVCQDKFQDFLRVRGVDINDAKTFFAMVA